MNEEAASSGGDLNEEEEEEKGHNPPHPNTLKGKEGLDCREPDLGLKN